MPRETSTPSFGETVEAFATALTERTASAPAQTRGPGGAPDERRFAVYRNNVAVALITALAGRYPVTRRLVGEDFFRAMARAYTASRRPDTPVLIRYGGGFPDFVEAFEPARDLPYLADVARLENAWVEAYHAAEASPLLLATLADFDAESLAAARIVFHPATRMLSSAHPVASIWAAHQGAGEPARIEPWRPEDALVTRPEAEVLLRALPPGGYAFAQALYKGATLADAHAATGVEDFDAGVHLMGLIEAGALSGISGRRDEK